MNNIKRLLSSSLIIIMLIPGFSMASNSWLNQCKSDVQYLRTLSPSQAGSCYIGNLKNIKICTFGSGGNKKACSLSGIGMAYGQKTDLAWKPGQPYGCVSVPDMCSSGQ